MTEPQIPTPSSGGDPGAPTHAAPELEDADGSERRVYAADRSRNPLPPEGSVPAERGCVRNPGARLTALDALRGFDMFWVIGGDALVRSLRKINDSALTQGLASQMEHCEWAGFHFYDLIFPMFVFIVGISAAFSLRRMLERQGRAATLRRIAFRSLILFLLGIFYMGGVANGFKNVYFAGVLHRIAVAYFFTGLLFCFLKPRALVAVSVALLLGYWALMTLVPVPGLGPPTLAEPGKNLAHYLDSLYLPGQKFEGTLLSTMAVVANCLLGVFAGLLLENGRIPSQQKVYWLLGAGVASVAAGFLWAPLFPIIKLLWTSSYVLVACGFSAILLALFYQAVELWGFEKWARPFVWVGMNALTIYLVANIISFHRLAQRFVGGDIQRFLGGYGELAGAFVSLGLALWVVHALFQKRIFLRL